jgi:hypothetical protein
MSENEQKPTSPERTQDRFVNIHLMKSTQFRVIHADGVWFGASPYGDVHLTFYNERLPIPTKLTMRVDQDGNAAEDHSKRESKTGFIRELEVDVVLTPHAALAFYQSLGNNLPAIQEAMKAQPKT